MVPENLLETAPLKGHLFISAQGTLIPHEIGPPKASISVRYSGRGVHDVKQVVFP